MFLLRGPWGCSQDVGWAMSSPRSSPEEGSVSELLQLVGRTHFLVVARLRSLLPCCHWGAISGTGHVAPSISVIETSLVLNPSDFLFYSQQGRAYPDYPHILRSTVPSDNTVMEPRYTAFPIQGWCRIRNLRNALKFLQQCVSKGCVLQKF